MSHPFLETQDPKEISEVNVVPLADVSLVLLIILLVLSPMMTQSMLHIKTAGSAVKPATSIPLDQTSKAQELVLAVALGSRGLSVGDKTFSDPGEFMAYLKSELSRRSDKKVFLTPHLDVTHGLVVQTLEMIKACGADSVALVQVQDLEEAKPNGEVRATETAP